MTADGTPLFPRETGGIDNNREYNRLAGEVEASVGILSLFVAACDDLVLRDTIIRRYEQELQPEICPYRVQLTRGEPSLRAAIAALVRQEEYLQQNQPAVITALGAEELLFISPKGERTEVDKFFGYLQWTREGLREFPCPIVLWVTNQILVSLGEKAPDFWSWRKGVFRFVPETPLREMPSVPVAPQVYSSSEETDDDSLPLEDLQDLIARIEQSKGTQDPKLGTLYKRLGKLYRKRLERGEAEEDAKERELAFACFNKAIALQTELSLRSDLVDSLRGLGVLNYSLSKYREAIDLYHKSLELSKEVGDRSEEASSLGNLGSTYGSLGQYREAIAFYEQSLAMKREISDRGGEASSLGNLGNVYSSLGQYREAIAFHEQSLVMFQEIGNHRREAKSLYNLGNTLAKLDRKWEAVQAYENARELCQAMELEHKVEQCNAEIQEISMVIPPKPVIVPPFQATPRKRRRRTFVQRIRRWLRSFVQLFHLLFRRH
ncbi:MAG: tetratricopeptide repeat protein [Cyanobacteriota bacterium]|nr:tetratricopeptide repeat protein [Cyanobacteriota bacterium]